MNLWIPAVLLTMILMLGCSSAEMTVQESTLKEMPACKLFEPPSSEKRTEEMTPREVVEQIAWGMRAKLQCNQDYYADNPDQLYNDINEILLPRFDRKYAAQLILARHWRTASEAQRERFINVFCPYLMQFYAGIMWESDLESLEILPFRGDVTKKRVTVKTIMQLDDGSKWHINYGMVKRDSGWLMFDFRIEDISYVRTYMEELRAEIEEKGLDGVLERLEAETSDGAAK